jgi:hypothetical protein
MSRFFQGSTGRWGVALLASSVFCSVSYVACGSPDRSFTEDVPDSGAGGKRDSGPDVSVGGHAGTGGAHTGGSTGSGGGSSTGGGSGSGGSGVGGNSGTGGGTGGNDMRDTGVDDAPTTGGF